MSRVSDLENKVAALERNVAMLAKLADVNSSLKIAEYSSISHYNEGISEATKYTEYKELEKELENRRREVESQFVKHSSKKHMYRINAQCEVEEVNS